MKKNYLHRRVLVDVVLVLTAIGVAGCATLLHGHVGHEVMEVAHTLARWITDISGAEVVVTILIRIFGSGVE